MSCLCIADLPLSEQIALELTWAAKLEAKARALLNALDVPADNADHPVSRSYTAGAPIPSLQEPTV